MNELWLLTVGALALAALAVVLGVGLWIAVGRVRKEQVALVAARQAMRKDLRALCNAAVAVGERINRAEQQLTRLTERQQELGMRQERMDRGDPEEPSYNQAIRLARKGAEVEELMEVCELTRGEAELIAMMHRLDQTG